MTSGLIKEMGHVALRTTDIRASLHDAQAVLGLRITEHVGSTTYLAAGPIHHELLYIESDIDAVDSLGMVARDGAAFQEIQRRVSQEGMQILRHRPKPAGVQDSFSFVGPEGFVFEIELELQPGHLTELTFGPKRYGHFNFYPTNPTNMKNFLERVLDFRVSDVVGQDFAYFLRCNSEHHGIAIIRGQGTFHHHAWETQSVSDLTKLGDRLHALGRPLLWGPVRHGAGNNIAAYYLEHTGNAVELYTDIEHIYSDIRPPVSWGQDDVWYNQWSDYVPPTFRSIGIAKADVVDGSV
jgi:catechol 2,3-dioxygenase